MERILFIDACMRGPELSRTYRLCRRFLEEYTARRPDTEVVHRDLSRCDLPLLTGELAQQRGNWGADHPLLAPAREVAAADLILVGAPYWDLAFPAALKVYLEWASTLGITFRYEEDGRQVGLSRARALVYCTTAGGPLEGQNFGFDYVKALGAMLGVPEAHCLAAQGLDIWGADPEAILSQAEQEAAALAQRL